MSMGGFFLFLGDLQMRLGLEAFGLMPGQKSF